jgi:hypothetical protein
MNYGFAHEGKVFGPDGLIQTSDVDAHNREQEQAEIEWLKTGPERVFLYVKHGPLSASQWDSWALPDGGKRIAITTWPGTSVATHVYIGPRRNIGFGWHSYRRAVSCRIFGVLYHGWYFESSGNYCRLRKAKRQA